MGTEDEQLLQRHSLAGRGRCLHFRPLTASRARGHAGAEWLLQLSAALVCLPYQPTPASLPPHLGEDEVQVALQCVAKQEGILVAVPLEHVHQVDGHLAQPVGGGWGEQHTISCQKAWPMNQWLSSCCAYRATHSTCCQAHLAPTLPPLPLPLHHRPRYSLVHRAGHVFQQHGGAGLAGSAHNGDQAAPHVPVDLWWTVASSRHGLSDALAQVRCGGSDKARPKGSPKGSTSRSSWGSARQASCHALYATATAPQGGEDFPTLKSLGSCLNSYASSGCGSAGQQGRGGASRP